MFYNDTAMIVICRTQAQFETAVKARDAVALEMPEGTDTAEAPEPVVTTPSKTVSAAASTPASAQSSKPNPERAERIYNGLTLAYLPPIYHDMLLLWYGAPDFVTITELSERLSLHGKQAPAMISKLSGRMKRIATPEELVEFRTPLNLLLEITYDEKHSSSHRLTPSGRLAVKKFLKL